MRTTTFESNGRGRHRFDLFTHPQALPSPPLAQTPKAVLMSTHAHMLCLTSLTTTPELG